MGPLSDHRLSIPGGSELSESAFGYFITACVVVILAIISYLCLPRLVSKWRDLGFGGWGGPGFQTKSLELRLHPRGGRNCSNASDSASPSPLLDRSSTATTSSSSLRGPGSRKPSWTSSVKVS